MQNRPFRFERTALAAGTCKAGITYRPRVRWAALVVLLLSGVAPAHVLAQRVAGTVVDEGGQPVDMASVALMNGERVTATAISNSAGRFVFPSVDPGAYVLRVQRIGYGTVLSDTFSSGTAGERYIELRVQAVPIRIEAVMAPGEQRCRGDAGSAADAAFLWQQVRSVLEHVRMRRAAVAGHWLREVTRDVELPDELVVRESIDSTFTRSALPYIGLNVQSLHEDGFIQRSRDGHDYYAPDAAVLLSEQFAQTHCFRVARHSDNPALVGLEFVPQRLRAGRHDVRGVLWVDTTITELTGLEFTYTSLPYDAPTGRFGGSIGLRKLDGIGWAVQDWLLRIPIYETRLPRRSGLPGWRVTGYREYIATANFAATQPSTRIVEAAGARPEPPAEVVHAAPAIPGRPVNALSRTASGEVQAVLAGVVTDAETEMPLARVRVQLLNDAADLENIVLTDSAGRFRLQATPGAYDLTATHVGYGSATRDSLVLTPGETRRLAIVLSADVFRLEALDVEATADRVTRTALRAFLERREHFGRLGLGNFMGREEISRREAGSAVQLLLAMPGVRTVATDQPGHRGIRLRAGDDSCSPVVFVDGMRIRRGAVELLNTLSASELEGVEIYRSFAEVPAEFGIPEARCGVIGLWTRRGL